MDIRERIRKMASGEINAEEELKKYEAQLKQQQEEARRKQQEEQEKQRKERAETAKQRAYENISNKNNMTSARTNFQTQNKEKLATAKKTDAGENTFNNFVSNIKENPQKVASMATNILASRKASDINSGNATASDKSSIILGNFAQGAFDTAIGAGNLIANPMAEGFKFLGKTFNNEDLYKHGNTIQNTMKAISEINSYSSKVSNKVDDKAFQTANTVSRTLGNMAPSIALSALTGGASGLGKAGTFLAKNSGGLLQAGSVAGNEITSNLNEDNSNFGQAFATGLLKGGVEYGTEKLFGGNILAKGTSLDNIVAKGISNKVKGKVGQFLLSKGYEFAGEQIEELIADNAGYVIDKLINNKDMPDFNEWLQNTGETAKTTFITSLVLQSLGLGGGTYNEVKQLNLNKQQEQEMNKWLNEAQNIINNANNTQAQQTTQPQNKVAQNKTSEQIRADSENFARQVDNVHNMKQNNDLVVLNRTPEVYKELGIDDLPMTITKNHTIWAMQEKDVNNSHLHGIDKEIIKQIPEALTKPLNVVVSGSRNDSIVAITELADSDGNLIIVPIKVNGKSNVNEIEIDANVLTSIYGKDNNYDTWMQNNIKKGRVLYDIDEGVIKKYRDNPPRLQLSNDTIPTDSNESIITNSIAQQNRNVKSATITNNYIQENQKYAQKNRRPSISELKGSSGETTSDRISSINSIPSQNRDVNTTKYSMQNGQNNAWQSYLDKNYKPTGTRTNMQDIKLPLPENKTPKQDNNSEETFTETEEKLAEVLQESPVPEKKKSRVWAIAKANLIDKGIVFEELSQKANNRDLQGKWDYTLTAISRGQNAIGRARYEFDAKTKQEKIISKSLTDIKAEVGDNVQDFSLYLYHKHNIDRMSLESKAQKQMQELKKAELKDYDNQAIEKLSRKRITDKTDANKAKEINLAKEYMRLSEVKNKPVFGQVMTSEMSQEVVDKYEKSNPEFKNWAQDVYDYNNANKQELVKNGVISQELADKFNEMYPHYVPISRANKQGSAIKVALDTNRTGINTPIARATGGNSDILPLFDTLAKRTLQTYNASARNNFGVELKNTLKGKQETEVVDMDNILDDIGEEHQELLKEGKDGQAPTFTVFDKGEKVTFEITQDMYDALKPLSDSSLLNKLWFWSIPNKVSNLRRAVLTEYNPIFSITNPIKDTQDILYNSQHPLKTYSKIPESVAQITQKGYWYKEYIQNGGEQNTYFNSQDNKFENERKKHPLKKVIKFPLNAISTVNKTIEMAPRLAEYIASREAGASIETAMLDAARVTTNFKAGGNVTKALNRNGFTFLNASVQGAMQQVRNIKEANMKGAKGYAVLASKFIISGLPAILLNNIIWGDDEDYKDLQDYVKDDYYVIAKYGDGQFLRIPKGRTVSVVQKLTTNVSEYITGDKELNIDNFAKDFWENIGFTLDKLAPNNPLDNNVLSPIIQVADNKSWYGEDIVPTRLQDKPKAEQYDETIDSFSIWLGQKLNRSPYKINYLLDQYGGGLSDVLLPAMTKQAENNVFEDKFTTDAVMKNKYAGEFYEKLDELKVSTNSDKATDNDILKYKYASQMSSKMSELYKEKREVQASDLSDEEKKAKIKEIQKKINDIAEKGISSIEDIKVSGNTAKVDDTEYYKVTNVKDNSKEWKKLSDEEKEKNKGISLKTYANYKEAVAQETIAQRKNGTIDDDASLKNKDKISILINANYINKEKTALYENYVGTEDTTYQVMKNTGINITEYLKYKMQDFSSDKQDDGTVDGKTVSGSSKKKTYEYVNKMNITYEQRLLLLGMKYSLTNTEKNKLAYYVNDLKLTKEEKFEVYDKLKGFTVYKNGRVTW